MKRSLIVFFTVIMVGIFAWWFIPAQVMILDGSFVLTVRIECPDGCPKSVSCEAFSQRELADDALIHLQRPESRWSAVAEHFDGEPIKVTVAMSGRKSAFGRELQHFQFRYLAVIAVKPDGTRVGKVVDLPDERVSRELSVVFP